MRTLEVRRHAFTKKGEGRGKGSHLSGEGVAQARHIGEQIGPFNLVLTSHIPRTLETAIAMGFAVDEQSETLGTIPKDVWDEIGHQERWEWSDPFTQFAQIVRKGGPTCQLGQLQLTEWVEALEAVPDGGSVLVVSHGRIMESGIVTAIPDGNFAEWGTPFHHGEGMLLHYENGQFYDVKFRRIERG